MVINEKNLDIKKLKLVIWDLDNTFWNGVISEEAITYDEKNVELLNALNRHGVVNSICSKNEYDMCKKELLSSGLWEKFVFPSIDWTDKGNRVFDIISEMKLRPENVLFLDDEPSNLQRALLINKDLKCGSIADLQELLLAKVGSLPEDPGCSRLQKYHELEAKADSKKQFDSDIEFLMQSEIKVDIKTDCLNQSDRIHELINRTNQLNFTKKRLKKTETESLLNDEGYDCGYVECSDKYSDYGIVGFYAVEKKTNTLIHFLFSCRTIGMGVEQYVYAKIGFPKLFVVGDVVAEPDNSSVPGWINLTPAGAARSETELHDEVSILIKGPCDGSRIIPFIKGGIIHEELAYVSERKKGMHIESFNHTSQILYAKTLSQEEKDYLISHVPFIDDAYFSTEMFSGKYDYIIFSMLTDYSLGLYQSVIHPQFTVPFGQYTTDYTNKENWENIQKILTKDKGLSDSIQLEYEVFSKEFKYIGRIPDDQLLRNLRKIRSLLPESTKLILLNGAEAAYPGECKPSHIDRHLLHRDLNRLVESFVEEHPDNCFIIDVNKHLKGSNSYLDTINHYKMIVYYQMASEIRTLINKTSKAKRISKKNKIIFFLEKLRYFRAIQRRLKLRD